MESHFVNGGKTDEENESFIRALKGGFPFIDTKSISPAMQCACGNDKFTIHDISANGNTAFITRCSKCGHWFLFGANKTEQQKEPTPDAEDEDNEDEEDDEDDEEEEDDEDEDYGHNAMLRHEINEVQKCFDAGQRWFDLKVENNHYFRGSLIHLISDLIEDIDHFTDTEAYNGSRYVRKDTQIRREQLKYVMAHFLPELPDEFRFPGFNLAEIDYMITAGLQGKTCEEAREAWHKDRDNYEIPDPQNEEEENESDQEEDEQSSTILSYFL